MPRPAISGGGTVHRLEHRRIVALGIDVARWRDTDAARDSRPQIRQDVPEQVAGDHDIEPVGMLDEMGRQDIDMVSGRLDVRIVPGKCGETFIPERHGVDDAV